MSRTSRGGHRRRRLAREAKYTMGVDLAASYDMTAIGHYDPASGVFHVDQILKVEHVDPNVIEGTAIRVETDRSRLLDAGGSEP